MRPWVWALTVGVAMVGLVLIGLDAWSRRAPQIPARHRAEALCFLLAQPPAFGPPMRVEPSAALVRGRFGPSTDAGFALRQVMNFTDAMVLREEKRRVGDFEVVILWLRLTGENPRHHWLVLGWMEDADLAVCNFRFEGSARQLDDDERLWGKLLVERVLSAEHFRRGEVPVVRFRAEGGASMPVFGPAAGR